MGPAACDTIAVWDTPLTLCFAQRSYPVIHPQQSFGCRRSVFNLTTLIKLQDMGRNCKHINLSSRLLSFVAQNL